tara:strand:- start:136 stop:453 length:318 start_codon:yes stop_codon:yes gene_type:complete
LNTNNRFSIEPRYVEIQAAIGKIMVKEILARVADIELWFNVGCEITTVNPSNWEEIAESIKFHLGEATPQDTIERRPDHALCVLWPSLVAEINAVADEVGLSAPW